MADDILLANQLKSSWRQLCDTTQSEKQWDKLKTKKVRGKRFTLNMIKASVKPLCLQK